MMNQDQQRMLLNALLMVDESTRGASSFPLPQQGSMPFPPPSAVALPSLQQQQQSHYQLPPPPLTTTAFQLNPNKVTLFSDAKLYNANPNLAVPTGTTTFPSMTTTGPTAPALPPLPLAFLLNQAHQEQQQKNRASLLQSAMSSSGGKPTRKLLRKRRIITERERFVVLLKILLKKIELDEARQQQQLQQQQQTQQVPQCLLLSKRIKAVVRDCTLRNRMNASAASSGRAAAVPLHLDAQRRLRVVVGEQYWIYASLYCNSYCKRRGMSVALQS